MISPGTPRSLAPIAPMLAQAFVSYGSAGGIRAVEHLRLVMAELQVADVRAQVALSLFTDVTNFNQFTPAPHQADAVGVVLDQVVAWSTALAGVRAGWTGGVLPRSHQLGLSSARPAPASCP